MRRSESGSSLVEFALLAPVMLFMLIGMIEIGRFAYFSILAANAARAGAQYGAQNLTTARDNPGIVNAVMKDGQNLSNWSSGITAQPLCSTSGGTLQACAQGSAPPPNTVYYVKVQVTGTFSSLLHYPGIPSQLPVSGLAVMRVASQ